MRPSIKVIPFPELPNCYIVISILSDSVTVARNRSVFSFFATVNDELAVEWEPGYGPVTGIHACGSDHPDAEPHWYFPFFTGSDDSSYAAIGELNLFSLFEKGSYAELFTALKSVVKGTS